MSANQPYFIYFRAKKKSGLKDLVFWETRANENRVIRDAANEMEDAGISDEDYFSPIVTNLHVVDDLPEEGKINDTWCERYQLGDDKLTWEVIPGATGTVTSTAELQQSDTVLAEAISLESLTVEQAVLSAWLFGRKDSLSKDELSAVSTAMMDTDASFPQNLLLVARSAQVMQLQHAYKSTVADWVDSAKSVWSPEGTAPQLADLLKFTSEWLDAHNDSSARAEGNGNRRSDITAKWADRVSKKASGSKTTVKETTGTGATAGGGNVTDRSPDLNHTLETLGMEIACALFPSDFNIYEIPASILRRAKEMVMLRETPWSPWYRALSNTPGILDYSRAAIFALIRMAPENIHHTPGELQAYINKNLTETDHVSPSPDLVAAASGLPAAIGASGQHFDDDRTAPESAVDVKPGPDSVKSEADHVKPEGELVKSLGDGKFDITAIIEQPVSVPEQIAESASNEVEKEEVPPDEKLEVHEFTYAFPAVFEPGRYEGVPNEVYHAANGISSSMVKDARISLMYYHGRHVTDEIQREVSDALTFGTLVHTMALEPEKIALEFAEPFITPAGALSTTSDMKKIIEEYNATLPALLGTDEIKSMLENYNAGLEQPYPLNSSAEDTALIYTKLPQDFRRIGEGEKHTGTAMKACIREYNATLPAPLKTSGSREVLLTELEKINPDVVATERDKPTPLNVSGSKDDMITAVRRIRPDAQFTDELYAQWLEQNQGKTLITGEQQQTANAIRDALYAHPSVANLLNHPSRVNEVSYFGMDDETGLEVRVRPDIELEIDGIRIAADLKTTSMGRIKQDYLRSRLHREITERDYHVSAAMYSEVAGFDQFFWIFVNKDPGYHWVAVIEASQELLELGSLEYHRTMIDVAHAYDTDIWPAPISEDYTDELNDFDLRRIDVLRQQL